MADVAQALLVPRINGRPDIGALYSALLVWDRVLVPRGTFQRAPGSAGAEILGRLAEHGAVAVVDLPEAPSIKDEMDEAFSWVTDLSQDFPRALDRESRASLMALMTVMAGIGKHHGRSIDAALKLCVEVHAAPLTSGRASFVAASLPPQCSGDTARTGRLITAALSSVVVAPTTAPDDVIRFRDEHSALRGRFRAAIIDLAESISLDAPPTSALEQARATVANRVEPVLADLERALTENRVTYLWRTLTAGAAVASGPVAPTVATSGAATFVTHSLAYAFNRKRLIAEHPFGFLHKAGHAFPSEPNTVPAVRGPRIITDPVAKVRDLWVIAAGRALELSLWPSDAIASAGNKEDSAREVLDTSRALEMAFAEIDGDT